MDSLTYIQSGTSLTFDIVLSRPWRRVPIHDPSTTQYLFTEWSADMVLTYNPEAGSFRTVGGAPAGGRGQVPPTMPPTTDAAIRAYLENPRGRLIVLSGGVTVLMSPQINPDDGLPYGCDAKQGPICEVNAIQEIWGQRTWQIACTWKTWVREDINPFLIVQNIWGIDIDTGENHLARRVITGEVVVRADLLLAEGDPIDTLRSQFAGHSIPIGFKRLGVKAAVDPDGNTVRYVVVDQEQMYSQPNNVAGFKIYVSEACWQSAGSLTRAIIHGATNEGPGFWEMFNPFTGGPAGALQRRMFGNLPQSISDNLPKRYKTVVARVLGDKFQTRGSMTNIGLSVINSRLAAPGAALATSITNEIIVSAVASPEENSVQVQATKRWDYSTAFNGIIGGGFRAAGEIGAILGQFAAGALTPADLAFANFAGQLEEIQTTGGANVLTRENAGTTSNPPFYNDTGGKSFKGVRGTWTAARSLDFIVSQALTTMGNAPADPT